MKFDIFPSRSPNLHHKLAKKLLRTPYSGQYSTPIVAYDVEGNLITQSDEQMGISPGLFKAVVAGDDADFRGNQQQDASEFMLHLFDALEKQAKKDNQTNPAKFFEFEFEERLEVNGKVQYQNIPETMLGVPIDRVSHMEILLS